MPDGIGKPESREQVSTQAGAFRAEHIHLCASAAEQSGVAISMRPATSADTLQLDSLYETKAFKKDKNGNYIRIHDFGEKKQTPAGAWIVEVTGTGKQLGEFRYYSYEYIEAAKRRTAQETERQNS